MATPTQTSRPRRGVFTATVTANRRLCDEHFLLRLNVGSDFPPTRAGQFVQLRCADGDEASAPVAHDFSPDRRRRVKPNC